MNIKIRAWSKLKYLDPKEILIRLRDVEKNYPLEEMPYRVATLRTKSLRVRGESRQCALFCYGMSQALGVTLGYAESEEADYDFIVCCIDETSFIPLQIKELVPEKVNKDTDIQKEINKLKKYVDSENLCVAIYINRLEKSLDVNLIDVTGLNIAELWLFGAASSDQSKWKIIGNLLDSPNTYEFTYPNA